MRRYFALYEPVSGRVLQSGRIPDPVRYARRMWERKGLRCYIGETQLDPNLDSIDPRTKRPRLATEKEREKAHAHRAARYDAKAAPKSRLLREVEAMTEGERQALARLLGVKNAR